MKLIVNISLKEGVLDPEGQAIETSLLNLGFKNFSDVRTGKQIVLNFEKMEESEIIEIFKQIKLKNGKSLYQYHDE